MSVNGMGSSKLLVSGSDFGDYNLEVSRIAYCEAEVVLQPLHVVLYVCTGEDVVLLCQKPLQDFREVATGGIEDLEDKHTGSDTQLQEGLLEAVAIGHFPLGIQSNDYAAFWWGTLDFLQKSRRHSHITCYHRAEELPLEWNPYMPRPRGTNRRGVQALLLRR